jgi:hypothetical protein
MILFSFICATKKGRDFFITAFKCAGNKKSREDPRGSPRL